LTIRETWRSRHSWQRALVEPEGAQVQSVGALEFDIAQAPELGLVQGDLFAGKPLLFAAPVHRWRLLNLRRLDAYSLTEIGKDELDQLLHAGQCRMGAPQCGQRTRMPSRGVRKRRCVAICFTLIQGASVGRVRVEVRNGLLQPGSDPGNERECLFGDEAVDLVPQANIDTAVPERAPS